MIYVAKIIDEELAQDKHRTRAGFHDDDACFSAKSDLCRPAWRFTFKNRGALWGDIAITHHSQ